MNKTIFFILDSFELYKSIYNTIPERTLCYSYFDTEEAIQNNIQHIVTYDIGHLSFDLEDLGYEIFIGYKGYSKRFYTGMSTANGKELRFGHNLRRLLIGGALDNDLHIERNKFYYDMNKSTAELLAEQLTKEKFNILGKIADATIGIHIEGTKAMTPEESYEWHKKHARIDPKTGNLIISDNEIGDGSYEKIYKKH